VKLFSKSAKVPNGRKAFEQLPLADRVITFYAEDAGSWPHFAPIVEALTGELGRSICYLTSAADDPILEAGRPNVKPFYIGEGVKRAFLFQTMEVGVLVATVPQLGISVLPRSRFAEKLGTRYVYLFHSMASTHMIYEPDGFDHYDSVLCVGPYMLDEIRAREAHEGLPAKELVEHGYGRLDSILADASIEPRPVSERPTVLVAPSWGPTCTFETIGVEVVRTLLDGGCRVIARPHPMTRKRSPGAVEELAATFASHPDFTLDEDIAATRSLHESDVMVSDWSGAALEYAFGRERPVVFLDVERKVNNPEYAALGIEPFEASVREQIGVVVDPADLSTLVPAVHQMTSSSEEWRSRLQAVREANIFNVGHSGRVAADHIAAAASAFTQARSR
jgi:hypothetical protein